jgi:integrase/recombinase XerD
LGDRVKVGGVAVGLAVVRDLREVRAPAGPKEIERFETDVVVGFVLARAAAGLSDSTIRGFAVGRYAQTPVDRERR